MEFLSKIESTFTVWGRGLVVVPEDQKGDFKIRVGTQVQLRTPDGRSLATRITGVEFLKPLTGNCCMAILLTRDLATEDVPVGTEIWYVREENIEAHRPPAN